MKYCWPLPAEKSTRVFKNIRTVFHCFEFPTRIGMCTQAILRRKCFADLAQLIDNAYQYIKYDLKGNIKGDMRMPLESTEQRTQLKIRCKPLSDRRPLSLKWLHLAEPKAQNRHLSTHLPSKTSYGDIRSLTQGWQISSQNPAYRRNPDIEDSLVKAKTTGNTLKGPLTFTVPSLPYRVRVQAASRATIWGTSSSSMDNTSQNT